MAYPDEISVFFMLLQIKCKNLRQKGCYKPEEHVGFVPYTIMQLLKK